MTATRCSQDHHIDDKSNVDHNSDHVRIITLMHGKNVRCYLCTQV